MEVRPPVDLTKVENVRGLVGDLQDFCCGGPSLGKKKCNEYGVGWSRRFREFGQINER